MLFGTPHFSHGLSQWAQIVIKTTAQSEIGPANTGAGSRMADTIRRLVLSEDLPGLTELEEHFSHISGVQRRFFSITRRDGWGDKIASCFPGASASGPKQRLVGDC